MTTRRDLIANGAALAALLAAAGLLPAEAQTAWNRAAFESKTAEEALRALGLARPVESKEVSLTAPDIAENGAVVPIAAASALPGVQRLAFVVEKNPTPLAGVFEFTDAVETAISTRIKMGQTSNVTAIAILADGRVLYAQKEVKVTLGGCGG